MSSALARDPFAPLTEEEVASLGADIVSSDTEQVPVVPVPEGVSPATFRHPALGTPSASWSYRDSQARLLGHVVRFDTATGKQVLPLTWCRQPQGGEGWRWKSLPSPRPLYGLDRLALERDAPVLVVEGEKTADAAQSIFTDHVVMTWPGGTNAVSKVDWTPLRGRPVIAWPDADPPGCKAMEDVARRVLIAGALSAKVVQLPAGLPTGWDLANPLTEGMDVGELLASARPRRIESDLPQGYSMTGRGLVWRPSDGVDAETLVAGPFEILAETRDTEGGSWGILLQWKDHDTREHRFALPRASLAGDGAEARRVLLDGGLFVAPSRRAREHLTAFLLAVRCPARVTATSQMGWHQSSFVLPDRSFRAADEAEDLLLQGSGATEHSFRQRGSLQDWQQQVAKHAIGNSRLILALSTAFAAPLVGPCDAESGGLHFRGASSTGKSTALLVAGSAWGGGETSGYVRAWRATANGLEGVALAHCDALLCLDELAQLSAREAGEVAYMLANGSGKSRSARDGSARRAARWRVLFLSSGEIGLADKVAEDGRRNRPSAGQQVRILDIPADAGAQLGLFEHLHGFPSADAFARHLKGASATFYGTAARSFLECIVEDLDGIRVAANGHIRRFISAHLPPDADGQVQRAAQRFALLAAGGELAVEAGVLPWPPGEATGAAARCFHDWIVARGGTEPAEVRDGIAQVRAFLLAHGMSRFLPAWDEAEEHRLPMRDIAGFRKREGDGWDYYVSAEAWAREVSNGYDSKALAAALAEHGMLMGATSRHRSRSVSVPGHGRRRLYHLSARLLEADLDE